MSARDELEQKEERPRIMALVGLNRQGIATLALSGAVGAGIGALVASRKGAGMLVGGALGIGLPIVSTLLILLPLRRLTLAEKEQEA
jgi:hypothetical protein